MTSRIFQLSTLIATAAAVISCGETPELPRLKHRFRPESQWIFETEWRGEKLISTSQFDVRVWNTENQLRQEASWRFTERSPEIALAPDKERLAVQPLYSGTLQIRQYDTGLILNEFQIPQKMEHCQPIWQSNDAIWVGSRREVFCINAANGTVLVSKELVEKEGMVNSFALSPDGSQVAVGTFDEYTDTGPNNALHVFDSTTGKATLEESIDGGVLEVDWDESGQYFAYTRYDDSVCVICDSEFRELTRFDLHPSGGWQWRPGSQDLILFGSELTLLEFDPATGTWAPEVIAEGYHAEHVPSPIEFVDWSENGRYLAVAVINARYSNLEIWEFPVP